MSRILSGIGLLIAAAILRMALHRLQDRAEDLRHSHISVRNGALARERKAAAPETNQPTCRSECADAVGCLDRAESRDALPCMRSANSGWRHLSIR
jgi:hypothetical protein